MIVPRDRKQITCRHWPRIVCVMIVMACLAVFASTASACPNCKDNLANPEQGSLLTGYFWSILYMMAMPFLILAGWSFYIWRVWRFSSQSPEGGGRALEATAHSVST